MSGRWGRMLADQDAALAWRALTDDRAVAVEWVDAGFTLSEAGRWVGAGWSLTDARELMLAFSGGWPVHPDELDGWPWPDVDAWLATGLPARRVLLLVAAGASPADARINGHASDVALRAAAGNRGGGSVFSHGPLAEAACPLCDCVHGHDPLLDGTGFVCGGCYSVITYSLMAAFLAGDL